MRPDRRRGGTAARSPPSCSTRRAAPRASSGVIPMSAGCATPATLPRFRRGPGATARCPVAAARAGRAATGLHLLALPRRRSGPDRRFFATARRRLRPCVRRLRPGTCCRCPTMTPMPSPGPTAAAADEGGFLHAPRENTESRRIHDVAAAPGLVAPPQPAACVRRRGPAGAAGLGHGDGLLGGAPAARASAAELTVFECLSRDEDGVYLSYAVEFELGRSVDDALVKSVPLCFVAEVEIFRDRWYWRDRRVAHAVRTWRIVYQPLTSTYRVTTIGGLSQSYPTRAEALASFSRGLALEGRRARPWSKKTAVTTSSSSTGSTRPSCRGRCRSASAASPTGSFRSSAHCASTESLAPAPTRWRANPPSSGFGPARPPPGITLGLDRLDRQRPRRGTGARLPALGRDQQPEASTNATTFSCSGSMSAWRACSSR